MAISQYSIPLLDVRRILEFFCCFALISIVAIKKRQYPPATITGDRLKSTKRRRVKVSDSRIVIDLEKRGAPEKKLL
jgi:hypothetical protein